jgi:hypothetical protein
MRRQQLTEAQITALFDPPMDQRELVRYYTFAVVPVVWTGSGQNKLRPVAG